MLIICNWGVELMIDNNIGPDFNNIFISFNKSPNLGFFFCYLRFFRVFKLIKIAQLGL